jgi:3-hydroxyisobutyrate dehydrogenase-like beta-hydroxyacid dehydrogenase
MRETIGFIGLGHMGLPMTENLLAAGFRLRVYNRSRDKAKPLAEKGAEVVDQPTKVATPGGIVVSMLADDDVLQTTAGAELIQALHPGGVHVSMSTVSPRAVELLAEFARLHDVAIVAAPVFGRPEAAAAKKLWICVSGDAAPKQRVQPVLEALGQGIFDFGEKVSAANLVKLAGNFLLTSAIESMAEAAALAEKHGIPRSDLLNMFTKTLFNCPIYINYARHIIDADFERAGFKAELAFKDMRLAWQTAADARAPMPTLSVLCNHYLAAIANGKGGFDASVLAEQVAREAGLRWP